MMETPKYEIKIDPLDEVCRNEDEAWKNCTNCVSLNFPTKEAIDNFINVLTDYKKEQFA